MATLEVSFLHNQLEERKRRLQAANIEVLAVRRRPRLLPPRFAERAGIDRIEAEVANESHDHRLGAAIVATIQEARPSGSAPTLVHGEQDLARHGIERGHHPRPRHDLYKLLEAGRRVRNSKVGVVGIHRQRAVDDDIAGDIARLSQHIGEPRPVHGQYERLRMPRRLGRRAGLCIGAGVARKPLELRLATRVAENHLVTGAGEERAELAPSKPEPRMPMRMVLLSSILPTPRGRMVS